MARPLAQVIQIRPTETDNVGDLLDDFVSRRCRKLAWVYAIKTMPDDEIVSVLMAAFCCGYRWRPDGIGPVQVIVFTRERR